MLRTSGWSRPGPSYNPSDQEAGNDYSKGAAYNEKADRRSREDMRVCFAETLQ
jgi:hypothetical protein